MRSRLAIVALLALLGLVVVLILRTVSEAPATLRGFESRAEKARPSTTTGEMVGGNSSELADGSVADEESEPDVDDDLTVCVLDATAPVAAAMIRHHGQEIVAGPDGCGTLSLPETTIAVVCATKDDLVGCATSKRSVGTAWVASRVLVARGSYLHVTVESESGRSIGNAQVVVRLDVAEFEGNTDEQGRLRLGPLPSARWASTQVSALGWVRASPTPPRLRPGDEARLRVRLEAEAVLRGVLVDSAGSAVDWTRLVAIRPDDSLFDAERLDAGVFRFTGLSPGEYDIEVSADGFASRRYPVSAPSDGMTLSLGRPTRIFGMVVDEDGVGLTARVNLMPLDVDGTRTNNRTIKTTNGAFEILDAAPGRYHLIANVSDENDNLMAATKKTIVVTDAPVQVQLKLKNGEEIQGRIVDSAGAPLSGATVLAVPFGVSDLQGIEARVRVRAAIADTDGEFRVRHLEPGRFRLNAWDKSSGESQNHLAVVQSGARGVKLEFKTRGTVTGQVVAHTGEPIQQFQINGYSVSDGAGRFEMGLGGTSLVIEARGWPRTTRNVSVLPGKTLDLGVIRLARPELITGQVVDRRTREPISNVLLSAHAPGTASTDADRLARSSVNGASSDTAGRFELMAAAGQMELRATHPAYLSSSAAISTARSVVVELDRGVEASGRVLDAKGLPLGGVTVEASSKDLYATAKADDEGRFHMAGLIPGEWRIGIDNSHVPAVAFVIPAAGLSNMTLRLPSQGTTVTVHLEGVPDLKHIRAVLVPGKLVPPRSFLGLFGVSSQGYEGMPSRNGFRFSFVPPGDYTLFVALIEFMDGDNCFYTMPLTIRDSVTEEISVPPPATVTFMDPRR